MAENNRTFSVNVTTSSPANLAVVPGQVQNAITATGDVAQYYANIARLWAISNELVLHEDYSSKYYAGQSKEQAALASDYSDMCAQYLSNFNEQIQDYNETFQTTLTEALADVTSAKTDAVNSIETLETSAIDNITDTTDTCTSAISTAVTNATATVNNNISTAQSNLTSFITTNISNAQNTINNAVDTAEESITSTVTTAQSTINSTAETAIDNIQTVADEQYVDGVTFHDDADVVDLEIVEYKPEWGNIQGTLSEQTDLQTALNNKVDKVEGKSLIADTEIARLADVDNYDDTAVKADIAQAEADIDNLETNKQDKLTAGEGISIVGDIISCTVEGGGGSGDVTAAGDNTFTGENTFAGNVFFAGADKLRVANAGATQYNTVANFVEDNSLLDTDIDSALLNYMSIGSTSLDNVFLQTPFVKAYNSVQGKDIANTMFHSGNLLAGNNITIERDGAKFKINAAGGGSVDIVTTLSADSTDTQVPSAKCVYDLIGNVETLLSEV